MTLADVHLFGTGIDLPFWVFAVGFAVLFVTLVVLNARFGPRRRTPAEPSKPVSDRQAAGCLFAFAGVFVLAGLAALFFTTIRPAYRAYRADAWPTTPGEVVSSRLEKTRSNKGGLSYRIDIHYRYAVDGRTFDSNQYDGSGTRTFSGSHDAKTDVVRAHRPGQPVTVHYNPADPADAMLSTALPHGTLSFVWFPAVFCVFPVLMVWSIHRSQNRTDRPGKAKPMRIAPAATDARRKRRRDAVIISVIALWWNGFIVFVWLQTRTGWVSLFLLPFLAVGVVMAAFAVQQGRALFNPVVSVSFSRMPIHPGEPCDVVYALAGNVLNVRLLSFRLEGREKVTFTEDTNTRTETKVVYVFPLTETTKPYEMEKGRFVIELPPDVMTSFSAKHNAFSWHLVCDGDIPRRPKIKDEFDVTVLAKPA